MALRPLESFAIQPAVMKPLHPFFSKPCPSEKENHPLQELTSIADDASCEASSDRLTADASALPHPPSNTGSSLLLVDMKRARPRSSKSRKKPKDQAAAGLNIDPNVSRRKRIETEASGNSTVARPSKVVVVKYTRKGIGERIESILNLSTPREENPVPLLVKESENVDQDSQPLEILKTAPAVLVVNSATATEDSVQPEAPVKATHPFFRHKAQPTPAHAQTPGARIDERCNVTAKTGPKENAFAMLMGGGSKRLSKPATGSDTEPGTNSASLENRPRPSNPPGTSIYQTSRIKYPSTKEPAWPWAGVTHIRGLDRNEATVQLLRDDAPAPKKSKGLWIDVPESEDIVLNRYATNRLDKWKRSPTVPHRLSLYGLQLKNKVLARLSGGDHLLNVIKSTHGRADAHPALLSSASLLESAFTAFDDFRCEQQSWVQKFAPRTAEDVLQPGKEVNALKEWLEMLRVNNVDDGKSKRSPQVRSRADSEKPKKKRKRPSEFEDFIVEESDEEGGLGELVELDEGSSRPVFQRSYIRQSHRKQTKKTSNHKVSNTILISGPNGCGKTAAVYAVAKELEFAVFEINSSSRRSGKDILDRIGNMTENHLVQRVAKDLAPGAAADGAASSISPSKNQSSMASFFKPAPSAIASKPAVAEDSSAPNTPRKPRDQKQSLILFEEVDVLFEDDKQFWSTVMALAVHSRRPVVLTCSDENAFSTDALAEYVHGFLRFCAPPVDLAVDYMLLIAAHQNHLLDRQAVRNLYLAKQLDLRATVTELQFFCQMGVGDEKGGLSWMIERYPPGIDINSEGYKLRSISEGTYWDTLHVFNNDIQGAAQEEHYIEEAICTYGVQLDDLAFHGPTCAKLDDFEQIASLRSAMDCISISIRSGQESIQDTGHPELSEKTKRSYVEAYPVIQDAPPYPFSVLDKDIALTMLRLTSNNISASTMYELSLAPKQVGLTRLDFSHALDPLALGGSAFTTSLDMTCLDREFRIITADIAPYVRTIAAYDLALEDLRSQMLQSNGGDGAKRARLSRASRSAAEGGKREERRRDRWFGPELNLKDVMATAPIGCLASDAMDIDR